MNTSLFRRERTSSGEAHSKNRPRTSCRLSRACSMVSPWLAISSSGHSETYPGPSRSMMAVSVMFDSCLFEGASDDDVHTTRLRWRCLFPGQRGLPQILRPSKRTQPSSADANANIRNVILGTLSLTACCPEHIFMLCSYWATGRVRLGFGYCGGWRRTLVLENKTRCHAK